MFGVRWGTTSRQPAGPVADTPPAPVAAPASRPADKPKAARQVPMGRAAALAAVDAATAAKLEGLLGQVDVGRAAGGVRTVVGVLAPDARGLLESNGHRVVALTPGTSSVVAARADVVVLDLDGFTGVWDTALSTSGVALLLELLTAVRAANHAGATCWVLVRGEHRSEIGALLLQRQSMLMTVHPGRDRPAVHRTEDAGDAPAEIADLLRSLEERPRD